MIKYILIILYYLKILNAVVIYNEHDLVNILSNNNDVVSIDIETEITVNINFTIASSLNSLSITGNPLSPAKLEFKYPIYFGENIHDLNIKDITLVGNLFFNNNERITMKSVTLNGSIDSKFNNQTNEYIKISQMIYKPSETNTYNCINLSGNVFIDNSIFNGNSKCNNRILHYIGLKKYNLFLTNNSFDGGYTCPCLSIEETPLANISNSTFKNAISSEKIAGGYI